MHLSECGKKSANVFADMNESNEINAKGPESSTSETVPPPTVPFNCFRCGLSEAAHFFGSEAPPFGRKQIWFNEKAFVMKDPFSPAGEGGKGKFLLLGGICSGSEDCAGSSGVCVDCSVYYAKRFCLDCATNRLDDFPTEVQIKIQKKFKAEKDDIK